MCFDSSSDIWWLIGATAPFHVMEKKANACHVRGWQTHLLSPFCSSGGQLFAMTIWKCALAQNSHHTDTLWYTIIWYIQALFNISTQVVINSQNFVDVFEIRLPLSLCPRFQNVKSLVQQMDIPILAMKTDVTMWCYFLWGASPVPYKVSENHKTCAL